MKILQISPSYKPAYVYGGPIESVAMLCEGLAAAGHEVDMFTTTANGETTLEVTPDATVMVDGVKVTYFRTLTKDPTFISPALWRRLFAEVKNYDIVHIQSWWNILVIVSAVICHFRGVKVVVSPRGMLSDYIFNSGQRKAKRLIHRFGGLNALTKSHFHATAEAEYRECIKLIPGWKGFVAPNILTLPEVPLEPRYNEIFTLVFLSRIHPKKGLEILFEAISKLDFNIILKIAGSGEEEYIKQLKKLAGELKISSQIEWLGWRSRGDKFHEFMHADLFVLVSHNENFANVVIESLHMGTPVLISEEVGLSDFVTKKDLGWVTTFNAEEVKDELAKAYFDKNKRLRINLEGRKVVEESFSVKKLIADYVAEYQKITGQVNKEVVKSDLLQALILTKDEEPNLDRVLNKLRWLEKVVILDSFSSDATLDIARSYPNVTVHQRAFDTHAKQWNYGLSLLDSQWVLSLDADYVLTDAFIAETIDIMESGDYKSAYFTNFKFLVFGAPLISDNTTPRQVLFRSSDCHYFDDGHTQRLKVNGPVGHFKNPILHDDRKSLSRWLKNQDGYSIKESKKLINPGKDELSLSSKIRKNRVLAPFIVFIYCLFIKGLIFNGWAGWHYTLQRTMVEMLLALRLIEEEKLKKPEVDDVR